MYIYIPFIFQVTSILLEITLSPAYIYMYLTDLWEVPNFCLWVAQTLWSCVRSAL